MAEQPLWISVILAVSRGILGASSEYFNAMASHVKTVTLLLQRLRLEAEELTFVLYVRALLTLYHKNISGFVEPRNWS